VDDPPHDGGTPPHGHGHRPHLRPGSAAKSRSRQDAAGLPGGGPELPQRSRAVRPFQVLRGGPSLLGLGLRPVARRPLPDPRRPEAEGDVQGPAASGGAGLRGRPSAQAAGPRRTRRRPGPRRAPLVPGRSHRPALERGDDGRLLLAPSPGGRTARAPDRHHGPRPHGARRGARPGARRLLPRPGGDRRGRRGLDPPQALGLRLGAPARRRMDAHDALHVGRGEAAGRLRPGRPLPGRSTGLARRPLHFDGGVAMGALIAIQFRLMWKGTPAFLRVGWGFLLVAAFVAVRERRVDNEALAVSILWPLGMLLIGLASAVTAGESLTWFTPIPRAERTWARLTVLTLTGIVTTAAILAVPAIAHIRIALPWPQLAAHLWLCWIGGGLLLLFLGDLIQSDVPAVQIFSILLGAVPGVGLSSYHLTEKCPWEVLLAEAGGVAVLVVLTRIVNVGEEVREHHYLPKAWRQPGRPFSEQAAAVAAESTTRKLDRRPSLASLLGAGLTASRPTVTLVTLWALGSLLPVAVMHAMLGLMVLPFTFQAALNYWRPFQTVPLSRPKAFVLLTAPILAVWILLVALHCLSSSLFLNTRLTVDASDGPRWQLPAAKRNPDVELSSELRRR